MALRPRGRAAHGPREEQVARVARTRGRRPRRSTRMPVRGATWREGGGVGNWRAHGLVDPSKEFGAVTQMRYRAQAFILTFLLFFFRVGLCSHAFLLCRTRGASRGVSGDRKALIAWTQVHTIID